MKQKTNSIFNQIRIDINLVGKTKQKIVKLN